MLLESQQRRQLILAATALAAVPLAAQTAGQRTLRIVTSHLPPLVMEDEGERPGALHELVTELSKRLGLAPSMQFVPWKRALFLSTQMSATAIFPLTRTPEREPHYRWLAQLFEENYVFLAPRGRAFDVHRADQMKDKRITLIRGSAVIPLLKEMGYGIIVEARSVDEVHRFLVRGMADAAFGELAIVNNSLRARGEAGDFDISPPVRKTAAWLAGSRDFSDADVADYQRAMKDMVADGTHLKILKKYRMA